VTVSAASPDGLAATVLAYLSNDQWPAFLAKYEKDGHPCLADQWGDADLRRALTERVRELGDEELVALQLLEFARGSRGQEFNSFKAQIRKRIGESADADVIIGSLAEFGFVKVRIAASGSVVEVVVPRNQPQRSLLREMLRLLRDEFGQ
jgi:hypothetical protein